MASAPRGWSTRELAHLAGTSVKAVRYYHDLGVLSEPERSSNGYKKYGVTHLLRLLRLRRLVALGVPASRIDEIDQDWSSGEVAQTLEAELTATIERLERARNDLRSLMRHGAPILAYPALARVLSGDFRPAHADVLTLVSALLSDEVASDYAEIANASASVDELFIALSPDASRDEIEALAQRLAAEALRNQRQYPSMRNLFTGSPRGQRAAEGAVAAAFAGFCHTAHVQVLIRAAELTRSPSDG